MRFQTKLKTSFSLIDLTPLVDVVFLMLIFFMITSNILPLKSLNIQTPALELDSLPLTSQIPIIMDSHHVIYMGSKKAIIDMATLKTQVVKEIEQLKKAQPLAQPSLVVSIDRRIDYGDFLRLFSTLQEVGLPIRLAYQTENEEMY